MDLKKILVFIAFLVLISPVFGVILADMVGYHESLDIAAEILDLKDITEKNNWTPFIDYSVPGLPSTIGYIISGFIGVTLVFCLGHCLTKILGKSR